MPATAFDYLPEGGSTTGTLSAGGDVSITRDTNFALKSGYFTAPFATSATIEALGYDDDILQGAQVLTLMSGEQTFVVFDDAIFDTIDEIVFVTGGAYFGVGDPLLIG